MNDSKVGVATLVIVLVIAVGGTIVVSERNRSSSVSTQIVPVDDTFKSPTPSPKQSVKASPRCTSTDFAVTVGERHSDGALKTYEVTGTNTGSVPCSVKGYPTVTAYVAGSYRTLHIQGGYLENSGISQLIDLKPAQTVTASIVVGPGKTVPTLRELKLDKTKVLDATTYTSSLTVTPWRLS